jgi:hypothetical protein
VCSSDLGALAVAPEPEPPPTTGGGGGSIVRLDSRHNYDRIERRKTQAVKPDKARIDEEEEILAIIAAFLTTHHHT